MSGRVRRLGYAILHEVGSDPSRELARLGDPAVKLLPDAGLAIAYSEITATPPPPELAELERYARVIETLHRMRTTVPLRYGYVVDTEAELISLLRRRRAAWSTALTAIEGCEEMGVRLKLARTPNGTAGPPPTASASLVITGPGAAYLERLRAQHATQRTALQELEREAEAVKSGFTGLYRSCRVEDATGDDGPSAKLAFLVPRMALDDFRLAFGRVRRTSPVPILLTGPWPPYHFVGEAGDPG